MTEARPPIGLRGRADLAGLSPGRIGQLLRHAAPSTTTRALDRAAREVEVVVAAWEIMSPEQRRQWLDALGVLVERPRRGRPRKAAAD